MKATGIVRRIDDLGRVVIPKEIRRSMRIKEGEPLEIFTTSDGCVCFKKYFAVGAENWQQFGEILAEGVCKGVGFALYNRDMEKQFSTSSIFEENCEFIDSAFIRTVIINGEVEGYIAFGLEEFESSTAVAVLGALIKSTQ